MSGVVSWMSHKTLKIITNLRDIMCGNQLELATLLNPVLIVSQLSFQPSGTLYVAQE